MRVFAAMPISDKARAFLAGVRDRLRAHDWPVRWVSDEGLHLTIRFYGEVPEGRIDDLGESLVEAVGRMDPLVMELSGVGVFPSRRRPRVIWMGVDAPPALELLHDRVERAAMSQGFTPARDTYRPHMTLGRVQRHAVLSDEAVAVLDRVEDTAALLADRVVLYCSQTEPGGARYRPLRIVHLEGAWAV